MFAASSEAQERAFDRAYREEVRGKWIGRLVQKNGTAIFGRVESAWPNEDGSVGLYIHVEEGVTSTNEYWTPMRRNSITSG
jgi:hypothetical protein